MVAPLNSPCAPPQERQRLHPWEAVAGKRSAAVLRPDAKDAKGAGGSRSLGPANSGAARATQRGSTGEAPAGRAAISEPILVAARLGI